MESKKWINHTIQSAARIAAGTLLGLKTIHQCKKLFKKIDTYTCVDKCTHIFVGTFGGLSNMIISHILTKTGDIEICLVDEGTANYCVNKLDMCIGYLHIAKKRHYNKLLCKYYHLNNDFFDTILNITNDNYLYMPEASAYPDQYSLKKGTVNYLIETDSVYILPSASYL